MISSTELAKLCGVSQGTVDRALHGRPGVSEKTRRRVQELAREHGYRANPVAHELISRRSNILGVLVPSINSVFFMDFLQALKTAANKYSLRLFISPVENQDEFIAALEDFAARRVRAVLGVPPCEGIEIPELLQSALPLATLLSPVANNAVPLFAPDERSTGQSAVEYLVNQGHRKILHVTYRRPSFAIAERQAGYERAMKTRKLSARTCLFENADDPNLWPAIEEFRPTAIFCHNDWLALVTIRLLESRGISVPGQISVMGVDDSPMFSQFQNGITTLAYPVQEIADKSLLWLIEGQKPAPISPLKVSEKQTVMEHK